MNEAALANETPIYQELTRQLLDVDDPLSIARGICVEIQEQYIQIGRSFSIIKHDLRRHGIRE